jgi:hypothetical protein
VDYFRFLVSRWIVRHILLLTTPLLLSGCYYGYGYYPYGYYPYGPYAYGYGGYPLGPYAAPQPYFGLGPHTRDSTNHSYGQPAALDPNNCGTPEEPKPCYHR